MTRTKVLCLRSVQFTYSRAEFDRPTIFDANLTVGAGEIVSVVGSSGCGKSTLLKIACAHIAPEKGSVFWGEVDIQSLSAQERRQLRLKKTSVVSQAYDLIERDSAFENVALPLLYSRIECSREEVRTRVSTALTSVGMGKHSMRKVSKLSGGQKQRVAVARALVNRPEFLIADEPTAALDHENLLVVCELLRGIATQGTAVLIATHDPRVARLSDRVVHMHEGRITDDDSTFTIP